MDPDFIDGVTLLMGFGTVVICVGIACVVVEITIGYRIREWWRSR